LFVCLFVCLFGGVSKAGEIRTLPKTSLPVAVLRVAKGRIPCEPDRVKAYVFHIALHISFAFAFARYFVLLFIGADLSWWSFWGRSEVTKG
jgi:hypothetical protein